MVYLPDVTRFQKSLTVQSILEEVAVREKSDNFESNEEEKTEPENLVMDSNSEQDYTKKIEDEGNEN